MELTDHARLPHQEIALFKVTARAFKIPLYKAPVLGTKPQVAVPVFCYLANGSATKHFWRYESCCICYRVVYHQASILQGNPYFPSFTVLGNVPYRVICVWFQAAGQWDRIKLLIKIKKSLSPAAYQYVLITGFEQRIYRGFIRSGFSKTNQVIRGKDLLVRVEIKYPVIGS